MDALVKPRCVYRGDTVAVVSPALAAGLPVLANVEAGHTDPMVTLPFGISAEIDARNQTLRLLETPTTA